MSFRMLSLAFAAALVFVAGPASAARIIVTIDGLHTAQGTVFVGLYASPAKFLQGNQADAQRRVKASTGPITVAFDNLAPGTYAVGAFHDVTGGNNLAFDAVPGWDFATGWGSMDGAALDAAWITYIKGGGA